MWIALVDFTLLATLPVILSLVSLPMIWASSSRRHWFARICVVIGIIAILFPPAAYEPAVFCLLYAAIMSGSVVLVRYVRERRKVNKQDTDRRAGRLPWPTFTLADFLLLIAAIAAVLALLANIPWDQTGLRTGVAWGTLFLASIVMTVVASMATWVALGRSNVVVRLILLCLMIAGVFGTAWVDADLFIDVLTADIPIIEITLQGGVSIMVWLGLGRIAAAKTSASQVAHRRTAVRCLRYAARGLLVFVAVAWTLPLGFIYWELARPISLPHQSAVERQTYNDLLRAARKLDGVETSYDASDPALGAFVAQYGPILLEAESVVNRPCRAPIPDSWAEYVDELQEQQWFRHLSRGLSSKGDFQLREGRKAEAGRTFANVYRLGNCRRDALTGDWSLGLDIRDRCIRRLIDHREEFSAEVIRELIATLQQVRAELEPVESVAERDYEWMLHVGPWYSSFGSAEGELYRRLTGEIAPLLSYYSMREEVKFQLLITEMAIQCYRIEHGSPPDRIDQLVPAYLSAIPIDPYSGRTLVFRRHGRQHLLYSIGLDREDNGGRSAPEEELRSDSGLDVRLSSFST